MGKDCHRTLLGCHWTKGERCVTSLAVDAVGLAALGRWRSGVVACPGGGGSLPRSGVQVQKRANSGASFSCANEGLDSLCQGPDTTCHTPWVLGECKGSALLSLSAFGA